MYWCRVIIVWCVQNGEVVNPEENWPSYTSYAVHRQGYLED
jgi:hypothetical protein